MCSVWLLKHSNKPNSSVFITFAPIFCNNCFDKNPTVEVDIFEYLKLSYFNDTLHLSILASSSKSTIIQQH